MLSNLMEGLVSLASLTAVMLLIAGAFWGILGGALPGISTAAALVLALPLTFGMEPALGLAFLGAVYTGGAFGGSISATLLNTPGTPEAAIMTYDGYALTEKGLAGKALWTLSLAALVGGLAGTVVLIVAAGPLAEVAVRFGPPEYVGLALLGLTCLTMLGGDSVIKSVIAATGGIMIAVIGVDPITATPRLTFDNPYLYGGIDFIIVLIGLFAVSEGFHLIANSASEAPVHNASLLKSRPSLSELRGQLKYIFLGSGIGTLVGIQPGGGATVSSIISYNVARQVSPNRDKFGTGQLEGLSTPEAADKASVGGALIPTLAIGIPGSASSAVLLGGLTLNNIQPGPQLLSEQSSLVYTLFAALLVANLFVLLIGLIVIAGFIHLTNLSKPVLGILILILSLIGAFATATDVSGMWVALVFGAIGYVMKRVDIPTAPVVLAIVLAPIFEINLRRSLLLSQGDYSIFLTRPTTLGLLVFSVLLGAVPVWLSRRSRRRVEAAKKPKLHHSTKKFGGKK